MSGGGKAIGFGPMIAQLNAQQAQRDALAASAVPQDPNAIQSEADKAAEEIKKRARKASGRSSTILTSPLGVVSPVQPVIKSLLGQ